MVDGGTRTRVFRTKPHRAKPLQQPCTFEYFSPQCVAKVLLVHCMLRRELSWAAVSEPIDRFVDHFENISARRGKAKHPYRLGVVGGVMDFNGFSLVEYVLYLVCQLSG